MLGPVQGFAARLKSLWSGVRRGTSVGDEMAEEFRHHVELRTEDLIRSGLTAEEAARQAKLEFGSPEHFADRGRQARGLKQYDDVRFSWLDLKLGARMLVKYPGLTIIGSIAIAFAIAVGTSSFEFIKQLVSPTLPFSGGDRIVAVRLLDAATSRYENKVLFDYANWKLDATTLEELGAFRVYGRNLITPQGGGEPVNVAEISATGFTITRVPPLLGRPLLPADETTGAPPVVVIGYDVWKTRFDGDPQVIGRTVKLGSVTTTIVGVMPEGYAFPISQNAWTPLQVRAEQVGPREGPEMERIFARLAPGVSLDAAQAQLTAIAGSTAARHPETHKQLRPSVRPFASSIFTVSRGESYGLMSINFFLVMLLVLVCGNVALLMFARAATRENEIIVRNALGASRRRIVMQLFAEALVLAVVGAAVGLGVSSKALSWGLQLVNGSTSDQLPFWFSGRLAPSTIVYALGLTILSAIIAGILPAMKVTAGGLDARLRQMTSGAGGLRFGGVWTAVIIAQVAVTITFPAVAFFVRRDALQIRDLNPGMRAEQFLTARLDMDRPSSNEGQPESAAAFAERYRKSYETLEQRLLADPAVASVTFADRLPLMYHPHRLLEVDSGGAAPLNPSWPAYRVGSASVGPKYFERIESPILSGHDFSPADHDTASRVVIVNEAFVRLVLGGRNPIGRRMRYVHFEEHEDSDPVAEKPGPWYQIIGVVRTMGMAEEDDPKIAGVYHPGTIADVYPAQLAIHVRGNPKDFAERFRQITTMTDPALRVSGVSPLDQIHLGELWFIAFWFRVLLLVSGIAMLLSLAGIYAVMSFAVSRRTREIGVRVALGATPRRVVTSVFARPLMQISGGIVGGMILTTFFTYGIYQEKFSLEQTGYVAAYSLVMLGVCLLACIVPTRRALRIQPTDALRAE